MPVCVISPFCQISRSKSQIHFYNSQRLDIGKTFSEHQTFWYCVKSVWDKANLIFMTSVLRPYFLCPGQGHHFDICRLPPSKNTTIPKINFLAHWGAFITHTQTRARALSHIRHSNPESVSPAVPSWCSLLWRLLPVSWARCFAVIIVSFASVVPRSKKGFKTFGNPYMRCVSQKLQLRIFRLLHDHESILQGRLWGKDVPSFITRCQRQSIMSATNICWWIYIFNILFFKINLLDVVDSDSVSFLSTTPNRPNSAGKMTIAALETEQKQLQTMYCLCWDFFRRCWSNWGIVPEAWTTSTTLGKTCSRRSPVISRLTNFPLTLKNSTCDGRGCKLLQRRGSTSTLQPGTSWGTSRYLSFVKHVFQHDKAIYDTHLKVQKGKEKKWLTKIRTEDQSINQLILSPGLRIVWLIHLQKNSIRREFARVAT